MRISVLFYSSLIQLLTHNTIIHTYVVTLQCTWSQAGGEARTDIGHRRRGDSETQESPGQFPDSQCRHNKYYHIHSDLFLLETDSFFLQFYS